MRECIAHHAVPAQAGRGPREGTELTILCYVQGLKLEQKKGIQTSGKGTLMVVSSEPEKTRLEEAARARTAPLCPVSVARHFSVFTSQTRTCHIRSGEKSGHTA